MLKKVLKYSLCCCTKCGCGYLFFYLSCLVLYAVGLVFYVVRYTLQVQLR